MRAEPGVVGLRVLLAEDEFLVAMVIEEALRDLGCEVIGPVADLDAALEAAQRERLDGALLDVNLNGRAVFPVAALLQERGVPFAFTTGYAGADLPDRFRSSPRVQKPANFVHLTEVIAGFGRAKPG